MPRINLQVCEYMEEMYTPSEAYLVVKLDVDRIKLLQLEVDIHSIVNKLVSVSLKILTFLFEYCY